MKLVSMLAPALVTLAAASLPGAAPADDFQLVEATIADIQSQYRAGTLSPEDVVRMYLARIGRTTSPASASRSPEGSGSSP